MKAFKCESDCYSAHCSMAAEREIEGGKTVRTAHSEGEMKNHPA